MFNHLVRRARKHRWELAVAAAEKIPALNPDVVVCSGDLATISAPREFEQAVQTLLPLVDDTSFELLYVPGNHDYYTHDPVCVEHLRQAFHTMNRGRWQLGELPLAHTFEGVEFVLVNEARPEPPYSSGIRIPSRPSSARRGTSSIGKRCSESHFWAWGRTSRSQKSRTVCRRI